MKPLVSVIVPLYNCEKYIEKCMASLLEQSYDHIEIIVVNDGSTDNSDEIMQQFIRPDLGIRYVRQANHGVAHARNTALKMATGKYILFVDADDYVGIHYVEDMVVCAEQNHSDLVISGFTMEEENNGKRTSLIPECYERLKNEIWAYRLSACCGRMYRKEFWDKYHLRFIQEKGARAEDVPITLFANAMAKNIAVVPNAEYYYVQHMGSAMHGKEKKVVFLFPYAAFRAMYEKTAGSTTNNSKIFFDMGVLKFLAQFEFVIYRRAERAEKRKFASYVLQLLQDDFTGIVESWKQIRKKCGLPFMHKSAIDLFVLKYRMLYGKRTM